MENWLIKKLESDTRLWSRFSILREKTYNDILPKNQIQYYTDHGVKHINNMFGYLNDLFPETKHPYPLTTYEIFLLLSAICLHDVGMLVSKDEYETDEVIRFKHPVRSKKFIQRSAKDLNLDENEAAIIGEICQAHGLESIDYLEKSEFSEFSFKTYGVVRIDLLAVLLRLTDILDVTYDRAPSIIAEYTFIPAKNKKFWDLHKLITNVRISSGDPWDIEINAIIKKIKDEEQLYELSNYIDQELHKCRNVLRKNGLFYKKIDLKINRLLIENKKRKRKIPFILLEPYNRKTSILFSGRDIEIQKLTKLIFKNNITLLIGESGVGKTSIVEAGIIEKLRNFKCEIVKFGFYKDPIKDICEKLNIRQKIEVIKNEKDFDKEKSLKNERLKSIDSSHYKQKLLITHLKKLIEKRKTNRILFIGDHFEQLFTIIKDKEIVKNFFYQLSYIIGVKEPISFLFCLREDYLPDLFNIASEFPEIFDASNMYKLFRLDKSNAKIVFKIANDNSKYLLSESTIDAIIEDLSYAGDGVIYPPYLQVVGHELYLQISKKELIGEENNNEALTIYQKLGKADKIINNYFEGIFDGFTTNEKELVRAILKMLVTEYRTKKRVHKEDIELQIDEHNDLDRILDKLVNHRIIKRTLGEYELIHDFLANKVIELLKEENPISSPVRKAIEFINKYYNKDITSVQIAEAAGVTSIHLASLFASQLGKSINKVKNEVRIEMSKPYLLSSLEAINDISTKVGFTNLNSFSRTFKQITGFTPREYRIRKRKVNAK
jgi:AraC-like DNA-binding protein